MMSDNFKGAALMALSMTAFTANDSAVKLLAGQVPLMQVVFLRGCLTSALIALLAWRMGAFRVSIARRDWGIILFRSAAEGLAAYVFLTALYQMPIADLTAILQALPLAVTLGAALFFGEKVGWRRWAAIGVGFLGVLLIIRPGTEMFTPYALLGVATVIFAAARDLSTRRLSRQVPGIMVTLIAALVVGAMGGVLGLAEDWVRPTPGNLFNIAFASVMVLIAYWAIIQAMRTGDVAVVAPMRYTGLLAAMVAGVVVFGEWPDGLMLAGAAIVVASGLFSFWRERRLGLLKARSPGRGAP